MRRKTGRFRGITGSRCCVRGFGPDYGHPRINRMETKVEMISQLKLTAVLAILAVNGMRDLRTGTIFLRTTVLSGVIGFSIRLVFLFSGGGKPDALNLCFSLLPGGLLILLSTISRGALGAGDGIVIAALGTILGYKDVIAMVAWGLGLAFLFAACLFFRNKDREQQIPFIPLLLAGYVINLWFCL